MNIAAILNFFLQFILMALSYILNLGWSFIRPFVLLFFAWLAIKISTLLVELSVIL
jgi:hypothetical protein